MNRIIKNMDLRFIRLCCLWIAIFTFASAHAVLAESLPAGSFEWPLANPANEYESVTGFDAHTAIAGLGGWKINASSVYAEVYKVRGNVGSVFPLAAPNSGTYYATLGSYTANNMFVMYNDQMTLEVGKTYSVSGYVSSHYGLGNNSGTWNIALGGVSVSGDLALLERGAWIYFSFTYVAETVNPSMSVGFNKTDTNHARVLFDGISVKEVVTSGTLPAGSFEWPLDNPVNAYESVSFDAHTAIPALGGWKINSTQTYAEIYKVRGDGGSIYFSPAAPYSGNYYVALGSNIAGYNFGIYSDPITLEPGKTYTVSGYISSTRDAGSNEGTWNVTIGDSSISGDLSLLQRGEWTYFSFNYIANTEAPSVSVGWIKSDTNHARVFIDGIQVRKVANPSGVLPEESFEWPLDNPNSEYESISFEAGTPISALGDWKVSTSDYYAEVFKVQGSIGTVFPFVDPNVPGFNYVTLGGYITNFPYALYSNPITLELGKTYTVSGFVSSAYDLGYNVGTWTISLGNASVNGDMALLGKGNWTPFSFNYVAENTGSSMSVGWTKSDSNHARVLFDAISVTKVLEPFEKAPVLSPSNKFISGPTVVTITSQVPNANIYYTTSGFAPTTSGTPHSSPVTVTVDDLTTLRAISVAGGNDPSLEASQTYVLQGIPIVGWYGIPAASSTLDNFQTMFDAGFTHSLSYTYTRIQEVQEALDLAYSAGMKLIPNFTGNREFFIARLKNHPALEAYFLRDEPVMDEFAGLAPLVSYYASLDENHWTYINILPTGGSYLDAFMNTVPVEMLSFDTYPITSGPTVYPGFFGQLEEHSQAARVANVPLWCFALSTSHWDHPIPTLAHLRYQIYSNLLYGAQGLQYFTYWEPVDAAFTDGPVDPNGDPTSTWHVVQNMNDEIRGVSNVFVDCHIVNVSHTGTIPTGTSSYTPVPPILSLTTSGSDGAVISELTNGQDEYLVVMNRDLGNSMTVSISVDETVGLSQVHKDGTVDAPQLDSVGFANIGPADIVILKKVIAGDLDGDGDVDLIDIAIMSANWLTNTTIWSDGDLNGDGIVNLEDFAVLANNWRYEK